MEWSTRRNGVVYPEKFDSESSSESGSGSSRVGLGGEWYPAVIKSYTVGLSTKKGLANPFSGSSIVFGRRAPEEKLTASGEASGGNGFLRTEEVEEAVEKARDLEAFDKESCLGFCWGCGSS